MDENGHEIGDAFAFDGEESPAPALPHFTDLGNARRFKMRVKGKVRHVEGAGWFYFDGNRFVRDQVGEIQRKANDAVVSIYGEIERAATKNEREAIIAHAQRSESEPRIRAMLNLARSLREIALAPDSFDSDPMLFGAGNGVLDLRDGKHRPGRPEDLISRGTDVPWQGIDAEAPRWEQFLAEVFDGDVELIEFVRRFAGYCLTGDTREQILAVFHGTGCNGKTELVETLKAILGDYAATSPFDTFTRNNRGNGGPRSDLARLAGARLAVANESAEGMRLDEATVKQITGGDTITARLLYREYFEFVPAFKLVLVSNYRPEVNGDDDAIWRRLRLVPFNRSFEGREDRRLRETLNRELPGILAWAVRGCIEWQRQGLGMAEQVAAATRSYREDSDVVGEFLAERCTLGEGKVLAKDLRAHFVDFCEEIGVEVPTPQAFGQRIKRRGITASRSGGVRSYEGVRICAESVEAKSL